jgi:hypothetical protein
MENICFPLIAVPSDQPARIRLAVVSSTERPPEGLGCLHQSSTTGTARDAEGEGRLQRTTMTTESPIFFG